MNATESPIIPGTWSTDPAILSARVLLDFRRMQVRKECSEADPDQDAEDNADGRSLADADKHVAAEAERAREKE